MKKIISTVAVIFSVLVANAQDNFMPDSKFRPEVFNIIATIFVVALFMLFILTIMKRIFEYRLKNKIVEKGIPENVVSSILQTKSSEDRNINIKWFALLAGIGAGLAIVNYTLPLGFHSLAIMAFSISISFLGYYFFLRQAEK
ncbi:MAG: hypothetical protein JJE22_19210 [Bacteroidia bacterium]|nr:hypothetical protein [Bacteroidia bacterium]